MISISSPPLQYLLSSLSFFFFFLSFSFFFVYFYVFTFMFVFLPPHFLFLPSLSSVNFVFLLFFFLLSSSNFFSILYVSLSPFLFCFSFPSLFLPSFPFSSFIPLPLLPSFLIFHLFLAYVLYFIYMTTTLKLMTANIRGLADNNKRTQLFKLFRTQAADIILLQETHCISDKEKDWWSKQWGGSSFWTTTSTRAGGCAVLVRRQLNHTSLLQTTRDPAHHLRVRLQLRANTPDEMILDVTNVYAPNNPAERVALFNDILDNFDVGNNDGNDDTIDAPTVSTIHLIGGDFNCIHDVDIDRVGGTDNPRDATTGSSEIRTIAAHLDLVDVYRSHHPDKPATTWRQGGVGSRLDRLYVPAHLADHSSTEIACNTLSDHDVVSCVLNWTDMKRGPSYWKLNTSILSQQLYRQRINKILSTWPAKKAQHGVLRAWDLLKKHIAAASRLYCSNQSMLHRCLLEVAKQQHTDALATWTTDPSDNNALQLHTSKDALRELEQQAYNAAAIRSRANWLLDGERPTRMFCSLEKQRQQQQLIPALQHPSRNQRVTDMDSLCDAARVFYQQLYTPEQPSDVAATERLIQHLPQLSHEQHQRCDRPISLAEITAALEASPRNKTPGSDGLPCEFYSTFWRDIGPFLLEVFSAAIEAGQLPDSMYDGIICLLYKKGPTDLLGNYRPLTMINTDAKLLAKLLARRLDSVIHSLVHPDQTGFVKGRYIHENSLLVRGMIAHHRTSKTPGAILFCDYEKAFDRVNWEYRDAVLQAFGFGPSFRSLVTLLHVHLQARVQLNGHLSLPLAISRGTRQGCPLSPGLFALMSEPLACATRAHPLLRGIPLPDGGYNMHAKISLYADDSTFFLDGPNDIAPLLDLLDTYGKASGARLNRSKSKLMLLGPSRQHAHDWTGLGVPIMQNHESIDHLGVPTSYYNNDGAIWSTCLDRLQRVLGLWQRRSLTLLGRITVLKTLACSQLWYIASVVPMPDTIRTAAEKAMFLFLWKGKDRGLVNRATTLVPRHHGGLGMVDITSMVAALQFASLRRLLDNHDSSWKHYVHHHLRECEFSKTWGLGLRVLLSDVKADSAAAKKLLPPFWLGILQTAQQLHISEQPPSCSEHVMQQHLFYNSSIVDDQGRSLGDRSLLQIADKGIQVIRHLAFDDGTAVDAKDLGISINQLQQLHYAIPRPWTRLMREGIARLQAGEWALPNRTLPPKVVWLITEDLGPENGYLADRYHAAPDSTVDTSNSPTPENSSCLLPRTVHLVRAQAVHLSPTRVLVEGPLDRAELDATRITVFQSYNSRPTPILRSSVRLTCEYLVLQKLPNLLPRPEAWLTTLRCNPNWLHVWRSIWTRVRRQPISDFLWRLWFRALHLGVDRRRFDTNINCAHGCNTVESYDHLFFACPVASSGRQWISTTWTAITQRTIDLQSPRALLVGPSFRDRSRRALFFTLQGELLYAIWTCRCRALFDGDQTAFTPAAVSTTATARVAATIETLLNTRFYRNSKLLNIALNTIRSYDLSRSQQDQPAASQSTALHSVDL